VCYQRTDPSDIIGVFSHLGRYVRHHYHLEVSDIRIFIFVNQVLFVDHIIADVLD